MLNVPKSLVKLLRSLQADGYDVGQLPDDGETLIEQVRHADNAYSDWKSDRPLDHDADIATVSVDQLEKWLGYKLTKGIEKQWNSLTETGIKTLGENFLVGGIQLGNLWIGVQPPLGISGDPMRLMFERDMTPHPQYVAFYKWLQNDYQAEAVHSLWNAWDSGMATGFSPGKYRIFLARCVTRKSPQPLYLCRQ